MPGKNRTDGKSQIEFDHIGIGTTLSRNRLVVPVNQREYSWEEKHVLDLFQDFSSAISQDKSSYFLGTIVLTAGDDAPEVADGQQRLATTTILLAAIRDYLHAKGDDKFVQHIENEFLFKFIPRLREIAPRLRLNLDDNEFFKNRILERPDHPGRKIEPTKVSHKRIERAAKSAGSHVEKILAPLPEGKKIAYLNQWVEFIEDTAQVVLLKVPDDLNAFVMFETLNDRGLKTSQTDLVKNFLFGEADTRLEEAQQKWAKMVGTLESLDIDDITLSYLRHLLSSIHGLTKDREIFERIKNSVTGRGEAIKFLDALADHANDYVAIQNSEHSKWNSYHPSIRDSIRTINELQAIPLRHVMLAVAKHFSPNEAVKAFRLFISWAVRFLVSSGGRGGRLEEAYAERAKEISQGTIKTAKQLAAVMTGIVPSDTQFESDFAIAQISKSKLARYLLRSLERKAKQEPEPEFIPNAETVINLEHILPENPGNKWGKLDPETARAFHRRLGNMVLLKASKNTKIGNNAFGDKLSTLQSSTFLLTSEVSQNTQWGTHEIIERQKKLAALAVKTWSLDVR